VDSDDRRGVVRITVSACGVSAAGLEDMIATHARREGPTHVDLPLSDPGAPLAVMRLRRRGFFFGALLPEFHQGDVLRLQRLARDPHEREAPVLESEPLRAIADFVLRDAAASRGGSP